MKTWIKVLLVTLVVAIPAFVLGPVLFAPAGVGVEPTAAQIPYFVLLAAWYAVFLGLGVAFLIFGMPVVRKVSPDSGVRAWAMYLSIGFLTVSWWPHLNLHASDGIDFQSLLYIDYGFHVPLMAAAAVLIYSFISTAGRRVENEPVFTIVRGTGDGAPLAESRTKSHHRTLATRLVPAEAITFGLGTSFLHSGFPSIKRAVGGAGLKACAMYLSVAWSLVSWWPHDNLQGLLYTEYGFHVTLMAAGLVLAYSLLTMLKPGEAGANTVSARVR